MTERQEQEIRPYGSWPSPITAARLVEGAATVGEVRADGDDVWWSESRPGEGGRTQLVRLSSGGKRHDLFPPWVAEPADGDRNWNARTAVMEYGGAAWAVHDRVAVFADWADQRLHRVDPTGDPVPVPISPVPTTPRGWRWSEPTWLDDRWLVCVRESHEPEVVAAHGEATNELVALPVDGSAVDDPSLVRVLASGADFVHSPAIAGDRLAWIAWDHPRMPWDGTELWLGRIERDADGAPVVVDPAVVAGGSSESIVQPGFAADGSLVFCTDRTGWWNPWRLPLESADGAVEPMLAGGGAEVEIGGPLWVGGLRWWGSRAMAGSSSRRARTAPSGWRSSSPTAAWWCCPRRSPRSARWCPSPGGATCSWWRGTPPANGPPTAWASPGGPRAIPAPEPLPAPAASSPPCGPPGCDPRETWVSGRSGSPCRNT